MKIDIQHDYLQLVHFQALGRRWNQRVQFFHIATEAIDIALGVQCKCYLQG